MFATPSEGEGFSVWEEVLIIIQDLRRYGFVIYLRSKCKGSVIYDDERKRRFIFK